MRNIFFPHYLSGEPTIYRVSLKKDPEFAPDKLRRNAIFCFRAETKKALILL